MQGFLFTLPVRTKWKVTCNNICSGHLVLVGNARTYQNEEFTAWALYIVFYKEVTCKATAAVLKDDGMVQTKFYAFFAIYHKLLLRGILFCVIACFHIVQL